MGVLQRLAPDDLRRVVVTYRDVLRDHQEELNRLNVYPVPDGDTGTNMALTLESVVGELPDDGCDMPRVCEAIRHGSLMGARGNSGVILSQILRGLADTFSPLEMISARDVVAGLRRGADAAYQAVLRPVEGTILTVVRMAAEAVEQAEDGELPAIVERAAEAARDAVARTPELLAVLRDAGVVDAGGRGFELFLDACAHVVSGKPLPETEIVATPAAIVAHAQREHAASRHGELRYEVMYFLHADDRAIPRFRERWGALGDSIVVVGGDGVWNCHVHTNDIGAAVEAGIEAGRPADIRVTDLHEQVSGLEEDWVREHAGPPGDGHGVLEPVATAVVAVAVGKGLERLFASLGVQQIVAGGQSMNPSTAQILEAVRRCRGDAVIVLPNNKNIVPVARQVPDLADRPVAVVPTTSIVEALAALVAYDASAPVERNVEEMGEAMSRVRAGEVTQAVRDSVVECGPINAGDWIALTREGVCVATDSAVDAAIRLLDVLIDDHAELVTVLVGADADEGDTARISEHLRAAYPDLEIEIHEGGQPLYPYLVGVE